MTFHNVLLELLQLHLSLCGSFSQSSFGTYLPHHLKSAWILESQGTENRDSQIVTHGLFVACRLVSKVVAQGVISYLLPFTKLY